MIVFAEGALEDEDALVDVELDEEATLADDREAASEEAFSEDVSFEAELSKVAELAELCVGVVLDCCPIKNHMVPAPRPKATAIAAMTAITFGAADLPAAFRALL